MRQSAVKEALGVKEAEKTGAGAGEGLLRPWIWRESGSERAKKEEGIRERRESNLPRRRLPGNPAGLRDRSSSGLSENHT